MFQIYTEKDHSELTRSLIGEVKDLEEAIDIAEAAIADKAGLRYIIEKTDGSMDSYGELIATVVAESD